MAIKIDDAIKAFINIREEKAKRERELKEWKASVKTVEDKLEKFIRTKMLELGVTTLGAHGNTAFEKTSDFISISDKDKFKSFIIRKMLLELQPFMYVDGDGKFQPDGETALIENVDKVLESDMFDLLTLSANKTNCKEFMQNNEGIPPAGVKYTSEITVQIRKGNG